MNFKLRSIATMTSLVVAGGAHAAIDIPTNLSFGNGSVLFVAIDRNDQVAMTIDLGLNMIDLVPGSALAAPGTSITWNFKTDTVAGLGTTGNAWSAGFQTFSDTAKGGDYLWGVISADSILGSGTTVTPTNVIAGRGWLATGNATAAQMLAANTSAPTGNGLTAANNFFAGSNFSANGNHNAAGVSNGVNVETSGTVFGAMGGNFGGWGTWNYLVGNGVVSTFQYQQQVVADPAVFQLGDPVSLNSLSALPTTFSFDLANGELSYVSGVPEPGTYALMLAGLCAVGAIARRRRA